MNKRILLYVFMFFIGWVISGWVFKIKEIYFPYNPIKPDTNYRKVDTILIVDSLESYGYKYYRIKSK